MADFALRDVDATVAVNSLAIAYDVLAGNNAGTVTTGTVPYVDLHDSGGSGDFASNLPFPGGGGDDFVIEAKGLVSIPAAGQYSFAVLSDDGFELTITGATFVSSGGDGGTSHAGDKLTFASARGVDVSYGIASFPAAGEYALTLVYYERGGGATVELTASAGDLAYDKNVFELVGDTANGGLAVRVPEPATLSLLGMAGAALLRRRRT